MSRSRRESLEVGMNARRIMNLFQRMIAEANVDDNFDEIFDDITNITKREMEICSEEYQNIREEVLRSIRRFSLTGQTHDAPLAFLNPHEISELRTEIDAIRRRFADDETLATSNDSRCGQSVVAARIIDVHPEPPRPQNVPRLEVDDLARKSTSRSEYEEATSPPSIPLQSQKTIGRIVSRPRIASPRNVAIQTVDRCETRDADCQTIEQLPRLNERPTSAVSEGEIVVLDVRSSSRYTPRVEEYEDGEGLVGSSRSISVNDIIISPRYPNFRIAARTISTSSIDTSSSRRMDF